MMEKSRLYAVLASLFVFASLFAYSDDKAFFSCLKYAGCPRYKYEKIMYEAQSYVNKGELMTAVGTYMVVYDFLQEAYATRYERYGYFLLELSRLLIVLDQQTAAYYFALESEEFWKDRNSKTNEGYFISLCRCFESSFGQGDTSKGLEYLEKIKSVHYNGPNEEENLLAVDEIEARLQYALGNYELAETLFDKVMKANPQSGLTNRILQCKIAAGKIDEAIAFVHENMNVDGEITSDKEYVMTTLYAQILAKDKSTLSEAIKQQEKAVGYIKSKGTTLTLSYAANLESLCGYCTAAGNVEKSVDVAKKASNIFESLLPYGNIRYASFLTLYSPYLEKNGYHELANKYALKASELKFDYITYNMLVMPEKRNQVWANEGKWFLSTFPSLATTNFSNEMANVAYNSLLIGKGMLLNTERSISEVVSKKGGEIKQLYEQMIEAEKKLSSHHLMAEEAALQKEYTTISNKFGRACYNDPSLNIYLNYTWEDVKKSLKDDEKAIEFFVASEFVDEPIYNALIIGKNDECPSLIKLCKVSELSSVPRTEVGERLYNLVWKNIVPALEGTKKVYFSPDGVLYQMPIEIPLKSLKGIDAIRLSSTRQLISRKDVQSLPRVADVFGGFKYGENITGSSANVKRAGMEDLPATKQEVETCTKLLNGASVATSSHVGLAGTEESFKKISGTNTNLIHIATHSKLMDNNFLEEISSEPLSQEKMDKLDMMNRAALMFTGANTTIKGGNYKEGTNDGILTASEIATMDLQDVDFAVLSACETAMGDVSGEGVFGLQRGFKKAGVKTIMMSLWKVDDNATMLFMNSFYKSWINDKEHNSIKALYDAQNAVKSFKGNINGKYQNFSDPKYWASFILLDAI
jgi:tetratricopeptide (TPR) repeat protein